MSLISRLRLDSLAGRLIAAAAVWTILALVGGGLILSNAFRTSVQGDFDSEIADDLDSLVAAIGHDSAGTVTLDARYLSASFQRAYSGDYWQVSPLGKGTTLISHSLLDQTLKIGATAPYKEGVVAGTGDGPDGQHLRILARRIEFPVTATAKPDDARAYMLYVAADTAELDQRIAAFNGTLIWSFVVLGLGLIVAIFLQVRVGLQPLRRVTRALHRIRAGDARRLEGHFPAEIEPLASELNSLIEHSAEVVGRARSYVSNLAHFLKTPLTVLTSEAEAQPGPLADAVNRQVGVMRRQVDHYLARARAAGALDVLGSRTPVLGVLDDLARTLRRIHQDRGLMIDVACPSTLAFKGERQDLEEMAGNLIDNACKWADSRVRVTATAGGAMLDIAIEDDGPGLTQEERGQVGERGERLDESVPGTGLGLAIVRDIAKLYGGSMELGASDLGGLSVRLKLPAIA
ncbi:MAG TPA: sensor histidine kinase [Rhizomicrobium sp.]|jgi:signal transduction histidine kinase|nr:sensor histidine kinase [Rhizomicrobium sp.]